MRYLKLTHPDFKEGFIILGPADDLQPFIDLRDYVLGEHEANGPGRSVGLTVSIVEMTEEEYTNLPEFEGF